MQQTKPQTQPTPTPSSFLSLSKLKYLVGAGLLAGGLTYLAPGAPTNVHVTATGPIGTAQTCPGVTYYVRTDGADTNPGTANTAGGAWRTINKGYDAAAPGDCVRVQAGHYSETATPGVSGTSSSNMVTIVADGTVTTCGLDWNAARNYVRTVGLTVDGNAAGCSNTTILINASVGATFTGLEFWNVNVTNTNNKAVMWDFPGNGARCDKCIWIGGTISNIETLTGATGCAVAMSIIGNDVYIGHATFANICYIGIGPSGLRGRYINNKFSTLVANFGNHPDNYYFHGLSTLGYSNSLVESMWVDGTPTSADNKVFHAEDEIQVDWNDNVFRLNVNHDQGSASAFSIYVTHGGTNTSINRWREYNNTFVLGDRAVDGDSFDGCGGGQAVAAGSSISLYLLNNIFYKCWADTLSVRTHVNPTSGPSGTVSDYNLAYTPDATVTFVANWTNQAHEQSNVNPGFVNAAANDFHLSSGSSGAGGTGGPLTTASGSGSNSTTLVVATNGGSNFIGDNSANLPAWGGKLVPGDFITVGSTTVQVASVSGDTITLATPISWSNGANVYFGAVSGGSVDIGAYPYKAGGYTLTATKSCAGATCTVTPSDNSLVRYMVCYENNVPYAVVNAAPYTCNNPLGTSEIRVYSRYASPTLYAVAN